MRVMSTMYRALLRAAVAIDSHSPELAPVVRAAVAPLLPPASPLITRNERLEKVADIVRQRFRAELITNGKPSEKRVAKEREGHRVRCSTFPLPSSEARCQSSSSFCARDQERLFRILKTMRDALRLHRTGGAGVRASRPPRFYRAPLDSSSPTKSSLLLVVGTTALVIPTSARPIAANDDAKTDNGNLSSHRPAATLLEFCNSHQSKLIVRRKGAGQDMKKNTTKESSTCRQLRAALLCLHKDLPLAAGGDVEAAAPLLVHCNPLVAHLVHQMKSRSLGSNRTTRSHENDEERSDRQGSSASEHQSNFHADDLVFVNDLRDVLMLPPRVVTTLTELNCRVFTSHVSREQLHRVMEESDPLHFEDYGAAINRCLFR